MDVTFAKDCLISSWQVMKDLHDFESDHIEIIMRIGKAKQSRDDQRRTGTSLDKEDS